MRAMVNIITMFAFLSASLAPASAQSLNDIMGPGRANAEAEARKMTAAKRQDAMAAKALFAQASADVRPSGASTAAISAGEKYDPKNVKRAAQLKTELDAAVAAYEEAEYAESKVGAPIPPAVLERLKTAAAPFIRFLNDLQTPSSQAAANTLTVNPGQIREFDLSAYCMDSNLPSPKFGETFRLVPAAQFMPPELAPVMAAMMRQPANHDSLTQSTVWKLRDAYKTKTTVELSDTTLRQMESVYPGASSAIAKYNQRMGSAKLVRGLVNRFLPGAQQLVSQVQSLDPRRMAAEAQARLAALDQLPLAGNIEDLAAYTTLQPGIAARATAPTGGARSVNVQIVNTTGQSYTFKPYEWTAVSPRGSQQIALQTPAGFTDADSGIAGLSLADMASFGLDMTALGNIKSAIQAVTGRDLLTGAETNRWIELAGIIPVLGQSFRLANRVQDGVRIIDKFTPINPGPLADSVAITFRSATYYKVELQDYTTLYRAYGGTAGPIGGYWTRQKPAGPLQAVIDSALEQGWGNTATRVHSINVPPGSIIFEGYAAPQKGLTGGGNQVVFESGFRVPKEWNNK